MNSLYEKYGNDINFITIYICEAHADDEWPIRTKKELKIKQHKTNKERLSAAKNFKKYCDYKWDKIYIDSIDNEFVNKYSAWPFAVFIIDENKTVSWRLLPENKDSVFDFNEIELQIK